jgi:hypothetical protein
MRIKLSVFCLLAFSLIIVGDVLVASTINVNNAGTTVVNGVYPEQTTMEGRPFYQKGNYLISWNYSSDPNNWVIHNFNNGRTYYVNPQNTPFPPQAGWEKSGSGWGTDPVPTLSGDGTLEVEMTNYSATFSRERGVTLTWLTESETGCAGFNIWRSDSGEKDYSLITMTLIPGHGNTSSANEYLFTDKNMAEGAVYYYKIEEVATDGERTFYGPISVNTFNRAPDTFRLYQNHPNPFNPNTKISIDLPEKSYVDLRIYDLFGKEVRVLINEDMTAGFQVLEWDGKDGGGRMAPSGIYFYKILSGNHMEVRKMTKIQ